MEEQNLTKIKTIGDVYMAVAGLNEKDAPNHAVHAAAAGMELLKFLENRNKVSALKWNIRIGIRSGAVVGGVLAATSYNLMSGAIRLISPTALKLQAKQEGSTYLLTLMI